MEPSSGKVIEAVAAAFDLALGVTSPVALGGAMNRVLRVSTSARDLVAREQSGKFAYYLSADDRIGQLLSFADGIMACTRYDIPDTNTE